MIKRRPYNSWTHFKTQWKWWRFGRFKAFADSSGTLHNYYKVTWGLLCVKRISGKVHTPITYNAVLITIRDVKQWQYKTTTKPQYVHAKVQEVITTWLLRAWPDMSHKKADQGHSTSHFLNRCNESIITSRRGLDQTHFAPLYSPFNLLDDLPLILYCTLLFQISLGCNWRIMQVGWHYFILSPTNFKLASVKSLHQFSSATPHKINTWCKNKSPFKMWKNKQKHSSLISKINIWRPKLDEINFYLICENWNNASLLNMSNTK